MLTTLGLPAPRGAAMSVCLILDVTLHTGSFLRGAGQFASDSSLLVCRRLVAAASCPQEAMCGAFIMSLINLLIHDVTVHTIPSIVAQARSCLRLVAAVSPPR